jgi:uncharacterized membrane protein YeaQ/YmgE (transglycosylase-associated protein family)
MRQLVRDVVAGLLGFAIGQLVGTYLQIDLFRLGQNQFLAGIAGTIFGLFVGRLIWRQAANTA